MNQSIQPWSLPVDPESKSFLAVESRLEGFDYIIGLISGAIRDMHAGNFQTTADIEDEWLGRFADFSGSLYGGGERIHFIWQTLNELTEAGYDVRSQWRQLRDSFAKMWVMLPEYYSLSHKEPMYVEPDQSKYVRDTQPPANYDPAKPFPQYPIPLDID